MNTVNRSKDNDKYKNEQIDCERRDTIKLEIKNKWDVTCVKYDQQIKEMWTFGNVTEIRKY